MKFTHEFRDPIHTFITLDSEERKIVDSSPFQRLRHIHQLATSFLIYPGASHKRFEHSLGVMHLAGIVFDVVTKQENIHRDVAEIYPLRDAQSYWRRVVRLAALCHDIGHLPFSHAAEDELLPKGWDHERLTYELVMSVEMSTIFGDCVPPIRPGDVAKLAIGQRKMSKFLPEMNFTEWENLLSEIIVGDAFGVDRMDYLLRDSYHAGVVYGRFDHLRLIQTLRILPRSSDDSKEPWLGVEMGGIEAAEAMSLARYFMYKQVYFHHVRRAYDIHLKDFLKAWLLGKFFPTDPQQHLLLTDNEVTSAMLNAARHPEADGHVHAKRIVQRKHFKKIYERNAADQKINQSSVEIIHKSFQAEFGCELIRRDHYQSKRNALDFPVLQSDDRIESSLNVSETLNQIPSATFDIIVCDASIGADVTRFLRENRVKLLNAEGGDA